MAEIYSFPYRSAQEWSKLEVILRDLISAQCISLEMENEIIGRMKDFFPYVDFDEHVSYDLPETLSPEMKAAVNAMIKNIAEKMCEQLIKFKLRLIQERLTHEVEVYSLRHPERSST